MEGEKKSHHLVHGSAQPWETPWSLYGVRSKQLQEKRGEEEKRSPKKKKLNSAETKSGRFSLGFHVYPSSDAHGKWEVGKENWEPRLCAFFLQGTLGSTEIQGLRPS